MSTHPLWLDGAPAALPPVSEDLRCDVVVIGAGLTGTAATLALAREGLDVVQLDARTCASGATGRNAGFILQGTAERYDRACAVLGRDRARRVHRWSLVNHDRIAATVAAEGIDCAWRRCGSLQLASSEREEAELVDSAHLLVEDGFDAQLVGPDALPPALARAGFRTGLVLPADGELHPARFVQGAQAAARARGARCFEHSPVLELDAAQPGSVRARTPGGEVHAQLALICTNARAGELLPWYADKVDPVRGQMLATGPAPRIFPQPIYADHGFDYWRQTPDGRIALGGWRNLDPGAEVGLDDVLHDEIQARMTAFLARFPELEGVAVTHRWSGTMGFSRDGLPLIGPAPGAAGALAAVGFTGHGFGFGWLAGEALAALVVDGQHPVVADLGPGRLR